MPAVGLLKAFYLATTDATEEAVRHRVAQSDLEGELLVEPGFQVGLLLYLHPCLVEQGEGLVFLLLSSEVVWHSIIGLQISTTLLHSSTSNIPM